MTVFDDCVWWLCLMTVFDDCVHLHGAIWSTLPPYLRSPPGESLKPFYLTTSLCILPSCTTRLIFDKRYTWQLFLAFPPKISFQIQVGASHFWEFGPSMKFQFQDFILSRAQSHDVRKNVAFPLTPCGHIWGRCAVSRKSKIPFRENTTV